MSGPGINVSLQKPASLAAHVTEKTYVMALMTPAEFMDKHGGAEFDLEKVKEDFVKHVKDFNEELNENGSYSVGFCSRMLYEIGPESRKVKKGTGDRTWALVFTYDKATGTPLKQSETEGRNRETLEIHTVYISTFKQEGAVFKYENTDLTMSLTMKQAALVAHTTFEKIVNYSYSTNKGALLTPLCGACFSRTDIKDMAIELGMRQVDLVIALNQSTQSGGHYLPKSDGNIAVCAAIAATRNLKEETVRRSIVTKTTKQYISKGKNLDKIKLAIYAKYATGGVPVEFSYENLIELFKSVQGSVSALKATKASISTVTPITGKDLAGATSAADDMFTLPAGGTSLEIPKIGKFKSKAEVEAYVKSLNKLSLQLGKLEMSREERALKREEIAERLDQAEAIGKTLRE